MNRRPSTQDVTWLLDLSRNNQLDLEPPYQRRSVWTLKDRQFFLDTIFRNYPSPSIFLHKTIDDVGKSTYHVVDGKQRLETIFNFVDDKIRLSPNYGDVQLDGKKWSDLTEMPNIRQRFWNYQITVDQLDFDVADTTVVNAVFDRLNRNSSKLTPQELRHAKYDGWLISEVETEATRDEWTTLGIVTKARTKRMVDCQFISELMLMVLENKVLGFDQRVLDQFYAKYDDLEESVPDLDEAAFRVRFDKLKDILLEMENIEHSVTQHAKGVGHFYTIWSVIALAQNLPAIPDLATRYVDFMKKVDQLASQENLQAFLSVNVAQEYADSLTYFNNSRGASTDFGPRIARYEALRNAMGII